jgi:hypothetical protein
MRKTLSLIGGALAVAYLSGPLYADSVQDSSHGTIVMLSKEETGIPGYYHQKYVFEHPDCLGRIPVDFYGAAIDTTDVNLLASERRMCSKSTWGDGAGSEGGSDD